MRKAPFHSEPDRNVVAPPHRRPPRAHLAGHTDCSSVGMTTRRLCSLVLATALAACACLTAAESQAQVPPPAAKDDGGVPLMIAGGVLFGTMYGVNAIAAATQTEDGSEGWDVLYAPVVGPLIAIETLDANFLGGLVLVVDHLVQATTLGIFIAGVTITATSPTATIRVAPLVGGGTTGLSITGTF
jgi:hypothetical protein